MDALRSKVEVGSEKPVRVQDARSVALLLGEARSPSRALSGLPAGGWCCRALGWPPGRSEALRVFVFSLIDLIIWMGIELSC